MAVNEELDLEFRPLEASHLDDVLAVENEAYPEAWSRGMFRDEIRNRHSYFYVAFHGDVLAGYGGFWLVVDEAHITSLTVRDVFRGRGIGRAILVFILEKAVSVGARLATLEVRESNRAARSLYERMGFKPVGVRKGYYVRTNESAVVMLKELERPRGAD